MHEAGGTLNKEVSFLSERNIWYIYIFDIQQKTVEIAIEQTVIAICSFYMQLFYMYISQTSTGKMWLGIFVEAFANRYQ